MKRSVLRPLMGSAAAVPLLAAAILGAGATASPAAATDQSSEVLAVFVRDTGSDVARHFRQQVLPKLRATADEMGLDLRTIDVAEGAPPAVSLTPMLVHVGPRGRSIFQGRYSNLGKLEHFVRTARVVPATGDASVRHDVAVLDLGRAQVLAPLKITPLAGAVPSDHDAAAFAARARTAFHAGLEEFRLRETVEVAPADRAFYMDVHPYRSADGGLHLSLDLYSQFHCLEPVFRRFDRPITGSMDDLERVFSEAARVLEAETIDQLDSTEKGDGFDPVPADLATVSWQALDLELPARDPSAAQAAADGVELPNRWRMAPAEEAQGPRLIFRFPAPLERYAGEAPEVDALLDLGASGNLQQATGWVEVAAASVTFGDSGLDHAVYRKLKVERFPTARFTLEKVDPDSDELAFGRRARMGASGTFSMMGMQTEGLRVDAELEPVIGEDGAPRLHVRARFGLDISNPFGLKGPEGPPDAQKHMLFFLDFLMEPAESGAS